MPQTKDWKTRLYEGASRIVQSYEFQRAVTWAKATSDRVRTNLAEAKRAFQEQLQMESDDDLKELKRKLARLEEKAQKNQRESDQGSDKSSSLED